MRWPWVSVRAYDLVLEERDRLRDMNDQLVMNLRGVTRAKVGLPEQMRPPRPERPKAEPVPDHIRALYAGFQSKANRDGLDRQCQDMRLAGTPWDEIKRLLEQQLGSTAMEVEA